MVMRTRISGSITRIVLGDASLGLGSSTGMSGERQERERVLGAFNEERRSSRSAEGRLGAVNWRFLPPVAPHGAPFAVAQDAQKDDPCLATTRNPGNAELAETPLRKRNS